MMDLPVKTEGVPGRTLFEVVYGSHAHGTATPTSDVDVRGVYLLPNDDFLGLHPPKTTWEQKPKDKVFWEIGHFCNLLLKGNPNLVGMLYVPKDCLIHISEPFPTLIEMRTRFLTSNMLKAYMGWIYRESQDLAGRYDRVEDKFKAATWKRLSHVPRLIWEIMGVVENRYLEVRPDEEKIEIILAMKTGKWPGSFNDAVAYCGYLMLDLEALVEKSSPLPEAPVAATEEWLLDNRHFFGARVTDDEL